MARCVYFHASLEDAPLQRSYDYVGTKTTVVSPLPAARPNRAETIQDRQTERTRQNYYYLFQMSDNPIKQNDQCCRTPTERGR